MESNTKRSKWNISKEVKKVIADTLAGVMSPKDIEDYLSLEKDLGLDSLDRHEIIMTLETKFDLEEIPLEELRGVKTVKGAIELIGKYIISI